MRTRRALETGRGWSIGNAAFRAGVAGLGLVLLAACGQTGSPAGRPATAPLGANQLRVTGTVHKAEVGANCWRFVAEDGTGYELRVDQAPSALLVEGKSATLVLQVRADLASVCMVGTLADVIAQE